jgi:outer membrane protein OmpA-like peptidoglycan-associated protein
MFKTLLTILFSLVLFSASAQRATDTFSLYFELGVAKLSPAIEKKIDLLVYNDKIINGSSVMIIGYADYLGSEKPNIDLSMERARNVKKYLVKYGINAQYIKLCTGKGEIHRKQENEKGGSPGDRKVDIVVNNMRESLAKRPVGTKGKKDSLKSKRPAIASTNVDEIKNLKAGATVLLKNVYFPPDRHTIKPESKETLEKLYNILEENPTLKISIEGHVCCIKMDVPDALDIETYEPVLSVNRARSIYNYLVGKGIDASRLKYTGFGRRKPVVPLELSDEDAEKNRRVEIRIIEK